MLAYRFNQTLFTHVIAANSLDDAASLARERIGEFGPSNELRLWHVPDIWTRRAVDMALAPGIIDTIPRFVVDTDHGPVYMDIDVIHSANAANLDKMRADSNTHLAWIDACMYQYIGDKPMREHVAAVASEHDSRRYALLARALAGAWGLGPIPEWHAAILPALIALDIETADCCNSFRDDVLEMEQAQLRSELYRCALITESVPAWCVISMLTLARGLSSDANWPDLRTRAASVLNATGWLQ